MKRNAYPIKRLSLEIFSIVFAVLLALGLDSWQERVKKDKEINKALNDIVLEVRSYTGLAKAIDINKKALDSLRVDIRKHQSGEPTNFRTNTARPEIRSLAWTTVHETGIAAGLDRVLLLDLAEIYVEYDRLNKILEYHTEFRLKSDPEMSDYTYARHIERHLRRSVFRMEELSKKAADFLERHKDAPYTAMFREE